ncbi:MAG: hypothetical protein NVSMB57_04180 [Actinomycetota bacterium]
MTRARLLFAALTLLALSLGGSAAHAGHSGSCNVFLPSSHHSCTFFIRGLPTAMNATVSTTVGTATVHAWLDLEPAQQGVVTPPVLECAASGTRRASCGASLSVGSQMDSTKQLYLATCHLSGTGTGLTGQMSCVSAAGF